MLIPLLDIYESLTEPFCSSCVLNSVRCEVFFVVDCEIHCGSSDDRDFSSFFCEFGNEKIVQCHVKHEITCKIIRFSLISIVSHCFNNKDHKF